MEKIINEDYSLNYNQFQTNQGVWHICGTDGSPKLLKDTLDEWRCGNQRINITRDKLLEKQNKGLINKTK